MFYLVRAEPVIPDSNQDFNHCNELDRGSNRRPVLLKKKWTRQRLAPHPSPNCASVVLDGSILAQSHPRASMILEIGCLIVLSSIIS